MLYTVSMVVAVVIGSLFCALTLVIGVLYLIYRAKTKRIRESLEDVILSLDSPPAYSLEECINFLRRINVIQQDDDHVWVSFWNIRETLNAENMATVTRWILKWSDKLDQQVASEINLMLQICRNGDMKVATMLTSLAKKAPNEFERFESAWIQTQDTQRTIERARVLEKKINKALKALEISEDDSLEENLEEEVESNTIDPDLLGPAHELR